MRGSRLPNALRVALVTVAAFALWWLFAPRLHAALAAAASPLLSRSGIVLLADRNVMRIGPVDLPGARAGISMAVVTSNLVLFAALWSSDRRAFRQRGLGRFLIGVAVLVAIQILALISAAHATLAVTLAAATGARYSTWEANAWFLAWQGYQVVGAWAAAFMAWWGLRMAAADSSR